MKLALAASLALSLVGCMRTYSDPPCTGCGPMPIDTSGNCTKDSDCGGGNVCARDGGCYLPSQVKSAAVLWTVRQQQASTVSCGTVPDLQLDFIDDTGRPGFGFAPVPCAEGRFSIDKLPTFYVAAQLGSTNSPGAVEGSLDPTTGQVTLDLPY